LINVKRKSLDTYKPLTSDLSKKRRPEGTYEELDSESLDDLDSPAVTFLIHEGYPCEPDIKLRIKKKKIRALNPNQTKNPNPLKIN